MEVQLDPTSILGSITQLKELQERTTAIADQAVQSRLDGSYSGVSGLDQLGGGHGGVLTGGAGSALSVLNSYAEQIDWLGQALAASYRAVTGQDAFVARGMDIADEGGVVGDDTVSFPTRPAPRFENFSFTPPVVTPALSLDQLSADFSLTKIAESTAAAATWKKLSADIASIAQGLYSVSQGLAGGNGGVVIDAAVEKIGEVARAGETFAQNSQMMGESVQQLAVIKSHGAHQVNLTRAALAAIVDPVQRKAAEQAFLASFPASFTPTVVSGVPPIRNLMSMEGGAGGGGDVALGMTDVDGTGEKHDASGLRPAGVGAVADALGALHQVSSAAQFSTVDAQTGDLASVGDHPGLPDAALQAGEISTGTASAGAAPPTLPTPPGAGTGTGGVGLPTAPSAGPGAGAGVPIAPLSAPATGPMTGTAASTGGRPVLGGTTAASVNPGAAGMPAGLGAVPGAPLTRGTTPTLPGLPGGGIPGGGGVTGGGAPGATSARPVLPGGVTASGAGTGAAGGVGNRAGGSLGGMVPGAAANPAAGTQNPAATGARSAATGAGQVGGRGMVPMMGAPMAAAGQAPKSAKVRTVTSTVEEDANVAALLGDRGPVVPGVIGAWARG